MAERKSAGSAPRARSPRRARGRITTGLVLGVMLGGGGFVTASGVAGASDGKPLLSQDQATRVAATTPGTGSSSTSTDAAVEAAEKSAAAKASAAKAAAAKAAAAKTATQAAQAATKSTAKVAATAAAVAAPPRTSTGQSITLAATQQPSQVGALFSGSISDGHHCTASVVDSPAGDVIVTAAHCLTSASGKTFVPAYRDGSAPYGVWTISQVLEDDAWTSDSDPDHDVAFAVVEPLNGKSLESVVGSYDVDTSGVTDARVQITGYPSATDEPISCTGSSESFSDTQLTVYCTGYASGTSGSGWVEDYDPTDGSGALVGVIGGYETGGDTDDVSYTALFGTDVQSLYNEAKAAG